MTTWNDFEAARGWDEKKKLLHRWIDELSLDDFNRFFDKVNLVVYDVFGDGRPMSAAIQQDREKVLKIFSGDTAQFHEFEEALTELIHGVNDLPTKDGFGTGILAMDSGVRCALVLTHQRVPVRIWFLDHCEWLAAKQALELLTGSKPEKISVGPPMLVN